MAKKHRNDIVTYNQNGELFITNDNQDYSIGRHISEAEQMVIRERETRPDGTIIEREIHTRREKTDNKGGFLRFFSRSN